MKNVSYILVLLMVILLCWSSNVEARGGRGRGGGGFFGSWRYYKRPSVVRISRRVISSPMITVAARPISKSGNAAVKPSSIKNTASYPKQPQMPNVNAYHSYYGANGGAHLPPGSNYYRNIRAVPTGAIYFPWTPTPSSLSSTTPSGNNNFLFGLLTGHFMNSAVVGHRPYQVYQQNVPQTNENSERTVLIINNAENGTIDNAATTVADVPLTEFNTSVTQHEAIQTDTTSSASPSSSSTEIKPPVGGIICIPSSINMADPNDASKVQRVKKIICFPAPPPPTATQAGLSPSLKDCVSPTKTDSGNSSQRDCVNNSSEQTPEPIPIAGEIVHGSVETINVQQ